MNCTACGCAIPDGAAFCPECGAAKVGMEAAPGMTAAPGGFGAATEAVEDKGGGAIGRLWNAVRSTLPK
jgi:hypothetical protein